MLSYWKTRPISRGWKYCLNRSHNPKVLGSNPSPATNNKNKGLDDKSNPCFFAIKPRTPRYSPQNERFSPLRFAIPPRTGLSKAGKGGERPGIRQSAGEPASFPTQSAPSPMRDRSLCLPASQGRLNAGRLVGSIHLASAGTPGGQGGHAPSGQLQLQLDCLYPAGEPKGKICTRFDLHPRPNHFIHRCDSSAYTDLW